MKRQLDNQARMDSHFGEVGVSYDEMDNSYFLDKDIEIEPIKTPVILYIQLDNERSKKVQYKAFKLIEENFSTIWENIKSFLIDQKNILNNDQLRKDYRLESITIPATIGENGMKWKVELRNLKPELPQIVIEMKQIEPYHFSMEE